MSNFIKITNFRAHPRNSLDGRVVSFGFKLVENTTIIGESEINVTVTGSLLPHWAERLPNNFTDQELGKLILKIIEDEVIEILMNDFDFENSIDLQYWSENNPDIEHDISNVPDIIGYEISI